MIYTIAIDGPVGAGKSSVADQVAQRLGVLHLDTGAMYRAFAYQAVRQHIDLADAVALENLTRQCMPEVRFQDGRQHTYMAGRDVTDLIRTPEVSMAASTVSKRSYVPSSALVLCASRLAIGRRRRSGLGRFLPSSSSLASDMDALLMQAVMRVLIGG